MDPKLIIRFIGITEILIGGTTLISNFGVSLWAASPKSPNVFWFVTITGLISTFIGLGILKFKKSACQLLIYFASVIILSKVLIFMNIIELNGALETIIADQAKNTISIVYHGLIIFYLTRPDVKKVLK